MSLSSRSLILSSSFLVFSNCWETSANAAPAKPRAPQMANSMFDLLPLYFQKSFIYFSVDSFSLLNPSCPVIGRSSMGHSAKPSYKNDHQSTTHQPY